MRKLIATFFGVAISTFCLAQSKPELTVQKIMQDPKKWIGTAPSNPFWSEDGKTIYFNWNPDVNPGDSLYKVAVTGGTPVAVSPKERDRLASPNAIYSNDRTKKLYTRNGDIFIVDIKTNTITQLTNTITPETEPAFTKDNARITYTLQSNRFLLNTRNGQITQLTDFKAESEKKEKKKSAQDEWLEKDELALISILKERKDKAEQAKKINEQNKPARPKTFYLEERNVANIQLSPDEKFITFVLRKNPKDSKIVDVPNYVTESSYTENLSTRTKVGSAQAEQITGVYDIAKDTIYLVKTDNIPGIYDEPAYKKDYPKKDDKDKKKKKRDVLTASPVWSADGKYAVLTVRAGDNKDRWIMLLDPTTAELTLLDRQHDDAWIGGPGMGFGSSNGTLDWLSDNKTIYFQSEETGYSHLYTIDVTSKKKTALTSGKYEVTNPQLSSDKKTWYFEANIDHPGDKQFYSMPVGGGKPQKLTNMPGANTPYLSPDESKIAVLYSASNKPWELFVMDNPVTTRKSTIKQLTNSLKDEFKAYPWRKAEVITFKASDGADVYARLYKPEGNVKGGPAVIFVHGAGYLQNAHHWWSSYFREYMFHNLLADKGYTVLDIDYRGSAGYGRDVRTGIYRFMGGKDLSDHVDGAKFLVDSHGVDAKKIGIYGGSYGGFITLMALFTEPDVFAAGAALRSVTDWAHYNHPYTANILNTPVEDSIAYRKSSPIYHAEGLKGALLICHGMIDTNVHFQDVVRLAQRLIELKKENWEFAVYPLEDHGFVEPSSWTDEYRRILKLFEDNLKK